MRFSLLALLSGAPLALADAAAWTAAYAKADAALAKLSQADKVNIVTGAGWQNSGPCVGNTKAINSIGYRGLCLQDGPLGVRYATAANAFTPGIQVASTWDRELMRQRGQYIGEEFRGVGANVMLGPSLGPLGKIAQGGRNWEGFGSDPYLQGIATAETIAGVQGTGVQACAKHYNVNEQELRRETISSDVDDRTLHELYLWPFADAVHADVASFMCSYNKLNGTWACENPTILNKQLKAELGFKGYVMTDWNAQHSTTPAAVAGLDMSMPGSAYDGSNVYWGPALTSAVSSGQVPQSRVDDMVRRILAAWYLTGQDSGFPSISLGANVRAQHSTNIRAVARDGIVLLKNTGGILPLKKPAKIAIVGSGAVAGTHSKNQCSDMGCNNGALGMGWGSGTAMYASFSTPEQAIRTRAQADGTQVSVSGTDSTSGVASAVSGADVALVFITADAGEGYITVENNAGDRINLDPWHNGNQLVQAVAGASQNVVVVAHSVGPIILETIQALPSVKAIVWAGLPAQESGNALVDILYGATSPNGKLPYTIAKREADYGTSVKSGNDNFAEGLFVDYRHFDQAGIAPRYEFGFGLSYTTFSYASTTITGSATSGPATGSIIPGGRSDLWQTVATVTTSVTNSGSVAGAEVAQLYVQYPASAGTPPRQLRGFTKLPLAAGASGVATFPLRRRDLSIWDVARQEWVVPAGTFNITVGASSRDLRQSVTLTVA